MNEHLKRPHRTAEEYRTGSWDRAEYRVATQLGGREVSGLVSWPFGAQEESPGVAGPFSPRHWVLTHLPTGQAVSIQRGPVECSGLAIALVLETDGTKAWDFVRPRRLGERRRTALKRVRDRLIAPDDPARAAAGGPVRV